MDDLAEGQLQFQRWICDELGSRVAIARDAEAQHGILHRLDIETSGPVLVATSYRGLWLGRLQISTRRVRKEYVCLCHGHLSTQLRMLTAPLRLEGRQGPQEGAELQGLRQARTEILDVAHVESESGEQLSLVRVRLHTGRRHQIRAHLSFEGHPLAGDKLYGKSADNWCPRLFLHSYRLGVDIGDGPLNLLIPLPRDLQRTLSQIRPSTETALDRLKMWQGGSII